MTIKERAEEVTKILQKNNPNPKTELNHKNDYELAVAVMLSAQTTDIKVNEVTKELFKKYKSWNDLASADAKDIGNIIKQVNFYKGKSERLVLAGKMVTANYGGKLPRKMSDLLKISGIARKSANVIMQEAWEETEGIVVDTHVSRVSNRLGLTKESDPKKIEQDLMKIVPKRYWRNISGNMVLHGRYVCTAKKPKCDKCILNKTCPSSFKV